MIINAGLTTFWVQHPTSPQNWLVLLCRFADDNSTPNNRIFYDGMFDLVSDFWFEASYGQMTVNHQTQDWEDLPQNRQQYMNNPDPVADLEFDKILNDCAATAVANGVVVTNFDGIAMFFNGALDGFSWGVSLKCEN